MAAPVRGGAREDYVAIRRIADQLLPALVARLEASPLGELEVSQDGWRVRLRKPVDPVGRTHDERPPTITASPRGKLPEGTPGKPPEGTPKSGGARRERLPEQRDPPRHVITSPAVGTFHPQAGSSLGKPVRGGDVVGRVEVLGVPQEVLAPFDGILGRLLVKPGQVVEYGEQLMRIELAGSSPGPEAGAT